LNPIPKTTYASQPPPRINRDIPKTVSPCHITTYGFTRAKARSVNYILSNLTPNLKPIYGHSTNLAQTRKTKIDPQLTRRTHHKVAYFDYPLDCQVNLTPTDRYARTDE
ncbi:MAG: hypothetical protein U9N87_09670, partial [Planctomycetota bacterium]|nr:hypothetical protein [Planctomycetota bacterium]